ncbi:MAG: PGF-pre-PGF domain-containing protein [Candidatus Peregrinibacteria bacterium]|nr:PGF-pre-PGF domain-containing protein [Candidatus Peregrinibacteria bacterium]
MKGAIFIFGFILMLGFANALTINQGVVLNSSNSNSSLNFSFAVNVSNFTIESNYILLYGINFTNATGTYSCENVNHSALNSVLDSSEFDCTQQELQVPSSGSPKSNYYIKERESVGFLAAKVRIASGTTSSMDFVSDKGTGVKGLRIKAKKYLEGDIEIRNIGGKPDYCNLPIANQYEIYKVIEINHTFKNDLIDEVVVDIIVNKNWLKWNNISKVNVYRCNSTAELLKTESVGSDKTKYKIYSDGFSDWVILGVKTQNLEIPIEEKSKSVENLSVEKIKVPITGKVVEGETGDMNWKITAGIVVAIILLIIVFGVRKKTKRKRYHNR